MSELYLKDKKVLTIKDIEGVPREIQKVDNPELLPVLLSKRCTTEDFNQWLSKRCIPENREGYKDMIKEFGSSWLQNKNYASLSDQYWIKKRQEQWKKINFFTNVYSKDIGNMAFTPWNVGKRIDNFSPDLTTTGIARKRWIQHSDRTSSLAKAASLTTKQEPLNEVLVSVLVEKLGVIPCVNYDLHIEGTVMCSICNNFITPDTELVPAYHIYLMEEKSPNDKVYEHLIKMCEKYDIPGAREFIDWVIFIDRITGNKDRHLSNIGFIRDINTMKFIGPAPLFDCASAYWNSSANRGSSIIKPFKDVEFKIFEKLKNKCNLEILLNPGYKKTIETYPGISDAQKGDLIKAISKFNEDICSNKETDRVR